MKIKNLPSYTTWLLLLLLGMAVTLSTLVRAQGSHTLFLPIIFDRSFSNPILAQNPGMHPEGIEWDAANERFLVGSFTMGKVFAVADDGTVTPFITSDNLAAGSVGIHIDKMTNRLLVAHSNPAVLSGDPAVTGIAQLGIYDLATGEELHFVDMTVLGGSTGRFFVNDVTADADGNAYVTNSESTEIYKVDMDGNAEIFVNNLDANGIDYHPDGYLLTSGSDAPGLFKIPVDDPAAMMPVALSEPALMDGIILDENGDLIAVAKTQFQADGSFEEEVIQLHSEDGWATAAVVARGVALPEYFPTTVALRDGNPYVVHAHFAEMAMGVLVEEFEIMRVTLTAEPEPAPLPDVVLAQNPGMHPEGVEWDEANERFLVGSFTMGKVFSVADDGTVTPFITSDNLAAGSVGIHIDKMTNRLLVAHSNPAVLSGDPAVTGIAQLGIYDLATGEELHFVDMTVLGGSTGRFFVNDVTADAEGNAYVTNSESTEIYKVDMDGNAEIFVNNLDANGIDYHPDGYLLTSGSDAPGLFKIPLDDPAAMMPVALSEPALMDGIILDENGDLIAVAKTQFQADGSFEEEAIKLHSEDGWASAQIIARGVALPEYFPTTVALRDGNPYVVHAHFAEMAMGVLVEEFEIMRVPLISE